MTNALDNVAARESLRSSRQARANPRKPPQVNTWTVDVSFTKSRCSNPERSAPRPTRRLSFHSSRNPTRRRRTRPRSRFRRAPSRISPMRSNTPFNGLVKSLTNSLSTRQQTSTCTSRRPTLSSSSRRRVSSWTSSRRCASTSCRIDRGALRSASSGRGSSLRKTM